MVEQKRGYIIQIHSEKEVQKTNALKFIFYAYSIECCRTALHFSQIFCFLFIKKSVLEKAIFWEEKSLLLFEIA